jgi:hypothetical protein
LCIRVDGTDHQGGADQAARVRGTADSDADAVRTLAMLVGREVGAEPGGTFQSASQLDGVPGTACAADRQTAHASGDAHGLDSGITRLLAALDHAALRRVLTS